MMLLSCLLWITDMLWNSSSQIIWKCTVICCTLPCAFAFVSKKKVILVIPKELCHFLLHASTVQLYVHHGALCLFLTFYFSCCQHLYNGEEQILVEADCERQQTNKRVHFHKKPQPTRSWSCNIWLHKQYHCRVSLKATFRYTLESNSSWAMYCKLSSLLYHAFQRIATC